MFSILFEKNIALVTFVGILFTFFFTCLLISLLKKKLPKDQGREYAIQGKLSAGKPRGAGIIFTLVFAASALLFVRFNLEYTIYIVLIVVEMLTGFLDDVSTKPWNEYKKGILDLLVAICVTITFVYFNSCTIDFVSLGLTVQVPPVLFYILAVILVWASINVTNCADGVDGLSGTLSIITLTSIYLIRNLKGLSDDFSIIILLFIISILGYLWYNATPSVLLMGDAGSRAMGIFISIAILKTGNPLLYLLVAIVLFVDGGIGLVKVALLRFLKIKILVNTKTPLHDHVRKEKGWSNTQTVFRFAIIQIVFSVAAIYLVL